MKVLVPSPSSLFLLVEEPTSILVFLVFFFENQLKRTSVLRMLNIARTFDSGPACMIIVLCSIVYMLESATRAKGSDLKPVILSTGPSVLANSSQDNENFYTICSEPFARRGPFTRQLVELYDMGQAHSLDGVVE